MTFTKGSRIIRVSYPVGEGTAQEERELTRALATIGKPSRKELLDALTTLTRWAVGGNRDGNPYCKAEIKQALTVLAREQGIADKYDAKL